MYKRLLADLPAMEKYRSVPLYKVNEVASLHAQLVQRIKRIKIV